LRPAEYIAQSAKRAPRKLRDDMPQIHIPHKLFIAMVIIVSACLIAILGLIVREVMR
jgi:hypothetical protein